MTLKFASRIFQKQSVILLFSIAMIVFGGMYLVRGSDAATSSVSAQAEEGTFTSPAMKVSDTAASAGGAVKFATSPQDAKSYPDMASLTRSGHTMTVHSANKPWSNLLGSKIDRFEVRGGDFWRTTGTTRSELSAGAFKMKYDTDLWFSYHIKVVGTGELPQSSAIGQLHTTEDVGEAGKAPIFAMYIYGYTFKVSVRGEKDASVEYQQSTFPRDRWVHVVYQVRASRTPFNGYIRAWMDGKEIVPGRTTDLGFDDVTGPYWKYGLYRDKTSNLTNVIEYSNMEFGYDSLLPRVANPLPIP